jgi:hypothetical protein
MMKVAKAKSVILGAILGTSITAGKMPDYIEGRRSQQPSLQLHTDRVSPRVVIVFQDVFKKEIQEAHR